MIYILGGWLLIGNVSLSDPSQASEIYSKVVKGNGQIASLSEATKGRFTISDDVSILQTLLKFTRFTELRVRCFKPWHGRTFHGILKGDSLMNKMFRIKATEGLCGSHGKEKVRLLAGDTSIIGARACENQRTGYLADRSFYNHLFYVDSVSNVAISSNTRFECDDIYYFGGFKTSGDWQFYVR